MELKINYRKFPLLNDGLSLDEKQDSSVLILKFKDRDKLLELYQNIESTLEPNLKNVLKIDDLGLRMQVDRLYTNDVQIAGMYELYITDFNS